MMDETVKHDTDALLLKYAPQSQDVDVCISNMQDRIDEVERERDELQAKISKMVPLSDYWEVR